MEKKVEAKNYGYNRFVYSGFDLAKYGDFKYYKWSLVEVVLLVHSSVRTLLEFFVI